MWTGGVRVAIFDELRRVLLVRHSYETEGKDIWMLPGGATEEGETCRDAAVREAFEETGLLVNVGRLLWHVEEAGERGQRFVNFFEASIISGKPELGIDPELGEDQVLDRIAFFSHQELREIQNIYPEYLGDELWDAAFADKYHDAYRLRD